VGIVYRVAAVTPVGPARALTKNIDPDFNSDIMRPSVAQTFVDTSGGKFTVVANHLKSKGSACTALGDPDTGDGQVSVAANSSVLAADASRFEKANDF
jgi:predicted extracellular nuclease